MTMPEHDSTPHPCHFDLRDPYKNLREYDALSQAQTCPHIRKTSKAGDVEVYAVMDSHCHRATAPPSSPCGKPESAVLRLIAKEEGKDKSRNRNTKPLAVACDLTSYRKDLLRFVGGTVQGEECVLEGVRMAIPAFYAKAHGFNGAHTSVRVEKFPDFELRQALVRVGATVWRGDFKVGAHKQPAELQVAIPPSPGVPIAAGVAPPQTGVAAAAEPPSEKEGFKTVRLVNPLAASKPRAVKVFFSYSHRDEPMKQELVKHLSILQRRGLIEGWHDRDISGGQDWAGEIDEHLNAAEIILLLVSADFINSDYAWGVEVGRAMERHRSGLARVIPVILREVHWEGAVFSKLQALPGGAKPVTAFPSQDAAFAEIARGIEKVIGELRPEHAAPPPIPLD